MSGTKLIYPPSPREVPAGFTTPSPRYRAQVVVVLGGLLVFMAAYLAAIASLFYAIAYAWSFGVHGRGSFWLLLVVTAVALFLIAFLVKGLFKSQKTDRDNFVEITARDEPQLFAFLGRLAAETGASMPKRVYLTHDVNAAVFYDTSFLSLIVPVRKNLLIGLGLVNALTVSELKAVLGHELGHFSQSAMKLGSYVYVANRIIADMIWGRDGWDDVLDQMKRTDYRIAIVAYLVSGLVWVLRSVMGLAFKALNFVHLSLSRQMEFHADRVAVSVAGSDALTEGLYRAAFADECFRQTMSDLTHAADHGFFTRDMFAHQLSSEGWIRKLSKKPTWGERPPRDGKTHWVFEDDPIGKPDMWTTHPPSHERERAAKETHLRTKLDDRSAWALFSAPEALRAKLTEAFLFRAFPKSALAKAIDPSEVQRFIDDERAETAQDERYHGMYDGRPLAADLEIKAAFAAAKGEHERASLLARHARLWDDEVAALGQKHSRLGQELALLIRAASGQLKGSRFSFRDGERSTREAGELLQDVHEEMRAVDKRLDHRDHEVLAVHAAMATSLGSDVTRELRRRYLFQKSIASIQTKVVSARSAIDPVLRTLSEQRELSEGDIRWVISALEELHANLAAQLTRAGKLEVPPLRNFDEGTNLGDFLLPRAMPHISALEGGSVQGQWIGRLLGDYAEVLDKLGRLHAKGMGALLACQVQIATRYRDAGSDDAAPSADPA